MNLHKMIILCDDEMHLNPSPEHFTQERARSLILQNFSDINDTDVLVLLQICAAFMCGYTCVDRIKKQKEKQI